MYLSNQFPVTFRALGGKVAHLLSTNLHYSQIAVHGLTKDGTPVGTTPLPRISGMENSLLPKNIVARNRTIAVNHCWHRLVAALG